jgi:hypothetical protein
MPGYTTPLEVYYCKQTESPGPTNKISPSPQISISPEIYYANDSVIGYTYNITLNGYANSLRKDLDAGSTDYGLAPTVDHIGYLREVFNTNGGNLYIKSGSSELLVAKGATIKQIEFKESDNRWVNYSPFTVNIEFNEVDFKGCDETAAIACSSGIFHQINNAKITSDNLIDIKNYKVKEFKDKWTFTIDDNIYDTFNNISNNIFKVNYNISAVGKNFYNNDTLVPAWQQARLFVQDRLYKQVKSLINGHLQINPTNNTACSGELNITQLYNTDTTIPKQSGLFNNFNTIVDGSPTYDIYNETITCSTSESDGSFSVTYEATVKKYNSSINPLANAAIHTYIKDINITTNDNIEASINVKGNIQGLVRGGFIYYNNDFVLPQNGTFITSVDSSETKYSNALNHYNSIVGSSTDLSDSTKNLLNIKKSQLLIKGTDGYPTSSSFALDHNYHEGSISYTAIYTKSLVTALEKGFSNISIVREDPVDMIQEFIVPGRSQGPIIQKLNMQTPRTVSVNIDGASNANKGCEIIDICNSIPYFSIANFEQLLSENNNWLKTKEDYTVNRLDGSYSISLEYIIRSC